jgi:KDO2-lipid IV(A) lauroyltransferase
VPTNRRGVKALFQTLQQQAVVGILPDQVPTEAGIFAPFFGRPTYTMVLVSRLAQRGNVPVIFTYAERLSKGRGFHVHFLPAPPTISAPDLEKAVNALNQGIEQCIQHCPTQYQWSYKRFKRQPTHLPSIY